MIEDGGSVDLGPVWPTLGVHVVFLSVSRADEVFVRVVLECHEGFGVARAHEPSLSPGTTLLTLLVVPDFAPACAALLADVAANAVVRFHAPRSEWIREIEGELIED